jgi:peptide/nickel transport system permease protein
MARRGPSTLGPPETTVALPSPALAEGPPVARGAVRAALRRLARDKSAVAGLAILGLVVAAAVAAPVIAPYSPIEPHYADSLRGIGERFLLGTDGLGRDELSRILFGARLSLASVALATAGIMLIGVTVGLVSGFYGGLLDAVLQRLVEILLAFPTLVLGLAVAGVLGRSMTSVLIAVVSVSWVSYARLVRGMVLSARREPYVEAARSLGGSDRHIMFREILPNILPPVVVLATQEMGALLLTISSLSFLGLGAQPPTPEWGAMLNQARPYFESHPMLMIAPGVAITLTVLACNLLGDGLRDALDPRTLSFMERHVVRRRVRKRARGA